MRAKIPLTHALCYLVASCLLFSGGGFLAFKRFLHRHDKKTDHLAGCISAIIQTGPRMEALKTDYLAELMSLSVDLPLKSSAFSSKDARHKLLTSPLIKEASVRVTAPNTLFIDYTAREPLAWLFDYENTAIDEEGYLFPVSPFFTPKNLPEIYLGCAPFSNWHIAPSDKKLHLAFKLLTLLSAPAYKDLFKVRRIDVSHAFASSYGSREIVLILEDELYKNEQVLSLPRLLRLSTKNYTQDLGNYLKLREKLLEKEEAEMQKGPLHAHLGETIVDLRLPELAFIKSSAEKQEKK